MRILYSHRIRSRDGQSVHLEAMVAALRAAGHEVRVVGPAGFENAGLGGESRMVSLLRQRLPAFVGELAELAYIVPATLRLRRAAAEFKPDVIYERANLFHLAGTLVAASRGIPLLLEVNAPLAEERARFGKLGLRGIAAALERLTWRRASRVLPVTEVLADHIKAAGVPASRITVVPNGIHPEDFAEAAAPARVPGQLVLGFVGFVREWHGMDRVVRALATWKGQPTLALQVVGDGPARAGLEKLAAELGISDRVRFTGLAAREDVPRMVSGFDIALQPASVAYASPLKVFEYMAAGRAIVAPDQPNLREVLRHGETALLFDPANPDSLWQAIVTLAEDPALRQRLGDAAREEIRRRDLTWAGNARHVLALAAEELGRRHGGKLAAPAE
ncbi:glycosyltransferase family 4 protein [Roseomonas marmotae]|uniref:Glycosyltransferase family 4 protein n=1 Tax=Roseomonas marmotae TaxID=2768161 RepID=A0ABS3KH22_9PROT|nr:glycosyltransferase family 4 protein [Roseomonas marmotae]MBO1076764.1 glycosyltransferase family 4 protein [Roseomonas marmotae]QTI78708.1 glycosyltransferase family 4 protein [Roseomonas marmotae]